MSNLRLSSFSQTPYLAKAVVEVNDSPEKAYNLYMPHYYKQVEQANQTANISQNYSPDHLHDESAAEAPIEIHRPLTTALINRPGQQEQNLHQVEAQAQAATTSAGVYDLAELRRKLVERMEYSKVEALPHDPTLDPADPVPSYASSTEARERAAQMSREIETRSDIE